MTFWLLKKLLYAALPYLVIGILLMLYNYLRFDSPFEFGQSYQLTITDQSKYGNFFAQFDLLKMCNGIRAFLVSHTPMSDTFSYVSFNGILLNFPLLCFGVFGMESEGVRVRIRENHMRHSIRCFCCIPVIIAIHGRCTLGAYGTGKVQDGYLLDYGHSVLYHNRILS